LGDISLLGAGGKKMSTGPGGAGNPLDIFTILSNLAFLPAAIQAGINGIWILFCVHLLIIVNSSMYHACNSFAHLCVFPSLVHRYSDFFFAQLILPATAFTLILVPRKYKGVQTVLFITFAFLIFISQRVFGESFVIQVLVAGISLLMIGIYWIIHAVQSFQKTGATSLPPYDWGHFTMAIGLSAVACSLYATEMQYHLFYWGTHSCWHGDAGMGQFFFLLARPSSSSMEEEKEKEDEEDGKQDGNDKYAVLDKSITVKRSLVLHRTPKSRV
jgi:hypothetical protein